MGTLDNQPTNLNLLSPLGFKFIVKKLPMVNYFAQTVSIPAISMGVAENITTPFGIMPRPGDRVIYDPLTIAFRVDEDLKNYIEIHNWMIGLGHPNDFTQTKNLSNSSDTPRLREGSASSFVSDGTLIILTSHKNANYNIFFYDMFPTNLTDLIFDSSQIDVDYLTATVTMRYRRYVIEKIS